MMRHYQASALHYLNSDQRQMRLKMLSDIQMGATLSTLREGRERVKEASQTYLVHREKANKIVGRPDPNPYSMTMHPQD